MSAGGWLPSPHCTPGTALHAAHGWIHSLVTPDGHLGHGACQRTGAVTVRREGHCHSYAADRGTRAQRGEAAHPSSHGKSGSRAPHPGVWPRRHRASRAYSCGLTAATCHQTGWSIISGFGSAPGVPREDRGSALAGGRAGADPKPGASRPPCSCYCPVSSEQGSPDPGLCPRGGGRPAPLCPSPPVIPTGPFSPGEATPAARLRHR